MERTVMNYQRFVSQVSFACFAVLCVEGLQPREAMAKWFNSLYAGQHDWATYSLAPGDYVLKASTVLNLGDVDIDIYDTTGQRFAKGRKMGSETIDFTVPQGAGGDFKVKYSMPFCINPAGACIVDMDIYKQ
jgi:hypothetical protein